MYGNILLLIAACVAYVAADGHEEGGHLEHKGCLDYCMSQYNMGSHDDWDNLQQYHDCVMYTDCGDDWEANERKEALMKDIKYMMDNWGWDDDDYNSASHPGVPVTLLAVSIFLALRKIYA